MDECCGALGYFRFICVRESGGRFAHWEPASVVVFMVVERDVAARGFHQVVEHFLAVAQPVTREPVVNAAQLTDDARVYTRLFTDFAQRHFFG